MIYIDNFASIEKLLDFSLPNTFYFIQILKRRKENPEMKTNVSVIDQYYIYGPGDLEKLQEKIHDRCHKYNARAYINLNRLDLEKIAQYTVKQTMDYIIAGDFKSVKNAYATVCGSHHSEKAKRWIIDVDTKNTGILDIVYKVIVDLQKENPKQAYKILGTIPTVNGYHIISNPFNLDKFQKKLKELDMEHIQCQKNSPTLLYFKEQKILVK